MSTTLVYVGYKTKATTLELPEPVIQPSGSATTVDGRLKSIEKNREKFMEERNNLPYTATFAEIAMAISSSGEKFCQPGDGTGAVAKLACEWLDKQLLGEHYPPLFGRHDTPELVFVGFSPRRFLKLLGIECSLPAVAPAHPFPLSLWYGNSDHRDIEEAVMPQPECRWLDWPTVVAARRVGLTGDALAEYDSVFADWTGPGQNAFKDLCVSILLASQIGLIGTPLNTVGAQTCRSKAGSRKTAS